ncbi:MAG TPA: dTDP-glucose 4,6-dehydratase [Blastocatellia bacterium]|nr:dTDP-glucose 4,6-dehydratase [Blastocatellia bacterium]
MESMIVTGGAGFIGSNFARLALARTNARILVLDKLTYAGNRCTLEDLAGEPRFVFVEGDIADRELVESIFREHRPTSVVNLAAETHLDRSIDDPRPFVDTNIVGTFVLLEAARRYVAGMGERGREGFRFLHVSTDEVYGTLGPTGLFSEETAYAPNSPYSASKAAADHLVRAYYETYRLPAIITNCSNNYGPYQFPEKLIPLTILNAIEGKPLPIYGDGGNVRDWLYVEDHCSGILEALGRGSAGGKYNIGGAGERTNLEVVDAICAALEEALPPDQNAALADRGVARYGDLKTFVKDRPGHDRRYAIDATKIRSELGWRPARDFKSGIADTVGWYINNRRWCETVQAGKYQRERLGAGAGEATERLD